MVKRNWRGWLGVLGLAWWCAPAHAVLVPSFDLPGTIESANVIVAARVLTNEHGPRSNEDIPVRITLAVSRTIKGPSHANALPLTVDFVDSPSFIGNPFVGDFAIFFLQCGRTTICTPASKHYLSLTALPRGPVQANRAPGATDNVIEELMALLSADDQELDALTRVVTSSGATRASVLQSDAASLLSSVLTPSSIGGVADRLKALARSPAPGPRLAAIVVLAGVDDFSMLGQADAEVLNPTPATEWLVEHLAHRMWSRGGHRPADLVMPMSRWLQSRHVLVRQSAASVLRELGSAEAGTVLARLGLDDPDPEVRYFSVGGLITAFGDGGYPSTDLYEKDEHRYLDPWLAWRDAHRSDIARGTCCARPAPPPEPVGVAVPLVR